MDRRRYDTVAPSVAMNGSKEGITYACMTTPHNTSLWQRQDEEKEPIYTNKGHLHIGSQALLPQPYGNPNARGDRITSGLPPPLHSAQVQAYIPGTSRPEKGLKNRVTRQTEPRTFTSAEWEQRRTMPRSTSAPNLSPLGMHYSMFGKTTNQATYRAQTFQPHVAAVVETDDEGDSKPQEADPNINASSERDTLVLPPLALNASIDSIPSDVLRAAKASMPATKPPGIKRALAETSIRRTRLLPTPDYVPAELSHEHFARPYRARADGERLTLPSKTEMIHRILHAHPEPKVSNSRSLYHYDPLRHTIGKIRDIADEFDAVAPRWK